MRKQSPVALVLLLIGTLVVSLSGFIVSRYQLPDFASGILLGTGIGLELVAVLLMLRHKRSMIK
jgi:hypothetical protein